MIAHNNADEAAAPCPSSRKAQSAASAMIACLVVPLAGLCAVFFSNNWCVVLVPACFAALILDRILASKKAGRITRVIGAALLGIVVGQLLNVGPDWAFEEMLGIPCPQGITDAHIRRHYIGGPGEHVLIVEFTGDEQAWKTLLALQPKEPMTDKIEKWQAAGGGWEAAFDVFAPTVAIGLGRRSWMRIRPLQDVEVFDLGAQRSGDLTLFREPATGRGVALHVRY